MFEDAILTLEYDVEGRRVTLSGKLNALTLPEASPVKLCATGDYGAVKVSLVSDVELSNIKARLTLDYSFSDDTRVFVNGYQSWTDSKEFFLDEKLPRIKGVMRLSKNLNCAGDERYVPYSKKAGVFHGWSYSYLRNGDEFCLIGSLNERRGYTIIRFDSTEGEISLTKDLEGVVASGDVDIFDIKYYKGEYDAVFDEYFADMKIPAPRVKHAVGYTSWYNYYTKISYDILKRDLDSFVNSDVKIDIFQIDDGYQTAVGDWLSVRKEAFPKGLKPIADDIHAAGFKAGLWLAPFAAHISSRLYAEHKDWLVKDEDGKPMITGLNWGGKGFFALDIYNEEARAYIKRCFDAVLGEWGFDMVKLDFLYCACMRPMYGKSRGQIMFEAMDFIRECVGDKLVLGCGVPLVPAFGKVDFCRTGADVGLKWADSSVEKKLHRERVSTVNGVNNSIFRRHLDGRAFVNDPDVFLMRDNNISLDFSQRRTLATINKLFGNLLFVSDDISTYGEAQKKVFASILADDKIVVEDAGYIDKNLISVRYRLNNVEKKLTIDMRNGSVVEGETF